MKSFEALFKAQDEMKELLSQCNLLEGISVNETELKEIKQDMYWHLFVKNTDASAKRTYLTYSVNTVVPLAWGDNKALNFDCSIELKIFTNKDEIRDLISTINSKADELNWRFEMSSPIQYESQSQKYTYTFILSKVIS